LANLRKILSEADLARRLHFDRTGVRRDFEQDLSQIAGRGTTIVASDVPVASTRNLELLMDVPLQVTLRFGERQLLLKDVLDLSPGSVVELDRQVKDPPNCW